LDDWKKNKKKNCTLIKPTYIASHLQATQANRTTKGLQKSCNRPQEAHENLKF
jgi:hypothetical protein